MIGMKRYRCRKAWTPEQRLAHFTRRDPLSGCLIWQGRPRPDGYGVINVRCRTELAHRFAWRVRNGPVPKGALLCHRCDERRCVNPDHLFLGTWQANMDDLKAKRLRRSQAADTGRMHIFIRGLELVGDVTWENEHEQSGPEKRAKA